MTADSRVGMAELRAENSVGWWGSLLAVAKETTTGGQSAALTALRTVAVRVAWMAVSSAVKMAGQLADWRVCSMAHR